MKLQLEEIRRGYSYPTDLSRLNKSLEIELFNHQMEEQQKEFDIISTILELSEKHLSINQKEEFHKSLEIILNTIKGINLRPKQTIDQFHSYIYKQVKSLTILYRLKKLKFC